MVAAKFIDDNYQDNHHFSLVGGVSNQALNELELQFVKDIRYSLLIESDLFESYKNRLLLTV